MESREQRKLFQRDTPDRNSIAVPRHRFEPRNDGHRWRNSRPIKTQSHASEHNPTVGVSKRRSHDDLRRTQGQTLDKGSAIRSQEFFRLHPLVSARSSRYVERDLVCSFTKDPSKYFTNLKAFFFSFI